jgi:hypothetical protein
MRQTRRARVASVLPIGVKNAQTLRHLFLIAALAITVNQFINIIYISPLLSYNILKKEVIMSFKLISKDNNFFNIPTNRSITTQNQELSDAIAGDSPIGTFTPELFKETAFEYPELLTIHSGPRGRYTVMIHATGCNNISLIKHIVKVYGKTMLNQANLLGETPIACTTNYRTLHTFIKMGADVNALIKIDPIAYFRWALENDPAHLNRYQGLGSVTVLERHLLCLNSSKQNIKLLLAHGACIQAASPLSNKELNHLAKICKEFSTDIAMLASIICTLNTCALFLEGQELIFDYFIDQTNFLHPAFQAFKRNNKEKEIRTYLIEKTLTPFLPTSIIESIKFYDTPSTEIDFPLL